MKFDLKREWAPLAILVATVALSLFFYPRMPEMVPTHWNLQGQPDDFSSREMGAWLMPALMAFLYLTLFLMPRLDPKRANLERTADTYFLMRTGVMAFLLVIHVLALNAAVNEGQLLDNRVISLAMGALFMVIGNYMPRMRPNWIMGVRTPWTLSSDTVWRDTHRVGGRLFLLGGLVMAILGFFRSDLMVGTGLVVLLAASLTPIAYSYFRFREEQAAK